MDSELTNEHSSSLPSSIAYFYISVPFLIFIWGWFNIVAAVISTILLCAGLFFAVRNAPRTDVSFFMSKGNIFPLICAASLALVWVFYSGIGGFTYQNYDFMWRNAILDILVERDWPVIISDTAPYFENPVALVYYFAFWLPSALVGKLAGIRAAEIFLYFWSVLGVLLVFYFICASRKSLSFRSLLIFVFFGGLDIVGMILLSSSKSVILFSNAHIENWIGGFQYSSITTQLFWVFNQAIPAWLITLLLLATNDNRNRIFIYSFSLIFCTLPAVGLLPLVAFLVIDRLIHSYDKSAKFKDNLKVWIKELFTVQNLLSGGLVGLTSFAFLRINTTGSSIGLNDMKKLFPAYILFVLLEVVVYFLVIRKAEEKKPIFYVALASLLIIPFFRAGEHIDFVMRASIPAMVVLILLICDALDEYVIKRKNLLAGILSVLILLGSVSAIHEMMRSFTNTEAAIKNGSPVPIASEIDLLADSKRTNFFAEYENSLFFRFIGKK